MKGNYLLPEITRLSHGDHLLSFFRDERERKAVLIPFIESSLARGEKALLLHGEEGPPHWLEDLDPGKGKPVARAARPNPTGRGIPPVTASVTPLPVGKLFQGREPIGDSILDMVARQARQANREGYTGVALACDMGFLSGLWDAETVISFERRYDAALRGLPVVSLCEFDLSLWDARTVLGLMGSHPLLAMEGSLYENIFYEGPGERAGEGEGWETFERRMARIRERKSLELERDRARLFAEAIVRTVRESLLVLDGDLRVISANPAFEETFAVELERVKGMHLGRLAAGALRSPGLMHLLAEVILKRSSVEDMELEVDLPHLGKRFLRLNARRVVDEGRFPPLILVALEDETDRHRQREAVEILNRTFLGLGSDYLDNMDAITRACSRILGCSMALYLRLEGGRIIGLGAGKCDTGLYGFSPDCPLIGLAEAQRGRAGALAIRDIPSSPASLGEDPLVKEHGFAAYLGHPVNLGERSVGLLSCYYGSPRDFGPEDEHLVGILAKALAIEEERYQKERSLKDFVDIASHELRHPLTLIKGYTATLRHLLPTAGREVIEEVLRAVELGADRMNELVKKLLDLSRLERGRFIATKVPSDICSLLRRAVEEAKVERPRVRLRKRGEVPPVMADPEAIYEVMVILLENALKFSPHGTPVDVGVKATEKEITVHVADRGVGVPPRLRTRIFDKFAQADPAEHHHTPGMGIGLYLAREIVETHGGRIWCEGRRGGGSVFRFTLPIERGGEPSPHQIPKQ